MSFELPMVRTTLNGYVVYRGPSLLTGGPVVAVMTSLRASASRANTKTGEMVQVYFLSDSRKLRPVDVLGTDAERDICGGCKYAGVSDSPASGGCYVNVGQGANMVWQGLQNGTYPEIWPSQASDILTDRLVRLGAYGDPACVPLSLLEALVCRSAGWTGYTHAWRDRRVRDYQNLLMASVDTPEEFAEAQALGWRTFRVKYDWEPLLRRETSCPASEEMQHKLQCEDCLMCCGQSWDVKSVAINVHGLQWKRDRYDRMRRAS